MIVLWLIIGALVISFGLIVLRGAPYVPSHRRQLQRAFTELYPLGANDVVVDLGSGDGVVCLEAARLGAGAVGYELNPFLVIASKFRLRQYKEVKIQTQDYLRLERLPEATTLVYAFTTAHSIEAVGQKMEDWGKGGQLYLISYGFELKNRKPLRSTGPMHLYEFAGKSKA